MTCDFTSFLTVFQSYQDDVWMIMKGCVQWNSIYGWKDFTSSKDRTRSARSVGQCLTHWATRTLRTGKRSWEIWAFLWELGSTDTPLPPASSEVPPNSWCVAIIDCSTFQVNTDACQSNHFFRQNSLSPLTTALGTKPPIRRFARPALPRPAPITFCFPCR